MPTHGLRVVWRADAPLAARATTIERHLRRFRPEVNRAVRALAARHQRLADLAASFPALAVALARPRPRFSPTPVIAQVIAGSPLAELAGAAAVPLWTRKLPPECFAGPVPVLPESVEFFRHIANHLPRSRNGASSWFNSVAFAAFWCGDAFGVWTAREFHKRRRNGPRWRRLHVQLLSLWAWYSRQPGTLAHVLIDQAWTPAMGLQASLDAAYAWWASVELHVRLGHRAVADVWLTPGVIDGYSFVPLTTAPEIEGEARVMQNCLRTFGPDVAQNYTRLWSIRRNGRRIATMQLYRHPRAPMLNIGQLECARNQPAPPDIWWAAQKWLHGHDLYQAASRVQFCTARLDGAVWRALWRPFWLAKKRVPEWLPLAPSENVLSAF
jgi:hypothetical protein